jgi:methylmalonyl-CoA mutase
MANEIMPLAAEAPSVTHDDWLGAVEAVLKGRPFDKVLGSTLPGGIEIEPLYTREDETGEDQVPTAGASRRGSTAAGLTAGWDIRQRHSVTATSAESNAAILNDLQRGVTSIELAMDGVDDEATLAAILDGVMIDLAAVSLTGAGDPVASARLLLSVAAANGVADSGILADLGCDPVGRSVSPGTAGQPISDALAAGASLAAEIAASHPGVRTFRVDACPYAHAGAAATTELAVLLSTGVAYLRAMTEAGLSVPAALDQILLVTTVGTDQFLDIAKLRALRVVWARVAEASGVPEAPVHVQAVTSKAALSQRDPWVNMLRTTIGCFAAAAGGADSITVAPFDDLLGVPDELGVRIARNTHLVLMEESNVHRVIDPAGGSWYVESLTDQLAWSAWEAFQEIEGAGGIIESVESGTIQAQIADTWEAERRALRTRRRPITGVSEFPDFAEAPVIRSPLPVPEPATHPDIELLPLRRLAADYEGLRDAAESGGSRPAIFLANLGEGAQHSTRSTWAKNLFEAGGIETLGNDGFHDDEAMVAAYHQSGARLAVLCSSDPVYADRAALAAGALKGAGVERLYLAGRPDDAYSAAGVDEFVFTGCDVIDTLEGVLTTLGIATTGGAP